MHKIIPFVLFILLSHVVSAIDFSMVHIQAPAGFVRNGTMLIQPSYKVDSNSSSNNISFFLHIFLSKDSLFDSNDVVCLENRIYGFSNQQTDWFDKLDLPAQAIAGNYLIAIIDKDNQFKETNESNNIAVIKIGTISDPITDLKIMPTTTVKFMQNEQYTIYSPVKNNGNIYFNGSFNVINYFSNDSVLQVTDELLSSKSYTLDLSPGYEYNYAYFPLNVKKSVGTYYIITKVQLVNAQDDVPENNTLSTSISIYPKDVDIVISDLQQTSSLASKGLPCKFSISLTNIGTTAMLRSDSIAYSYYLSEDSLLDLNDGKLGNYKSNYFGTYQFTINMPEIWPGTSGYVIAAANFIPSDGIPETNTMNNFRSIKFQFSTPLPDLTVSDGDNNYYFATTAFIDVEGKDNSYDYSFLVSNTGNVDAKNVPMSIYFSSDTVFSSDDLKLNDTVFASIPAEAYYPYSPALEHLNLPMGTNYIIVNVDLMPLS